MKYPQRKDSNKTWLTSSADPATLCPIAHVADQDAAYCTAVVAEAVKAAAELRAMTGRMKAALLQRWFELMNDAADDLCRIITRENGKPLAEAQGEVKYASEFLWWFAGEAQRLNGQVGIRFLRRILFLFSDID